MSNYTLSPVTMDLNSIINTGSEPKTYPVKVKYVTKDGEEKTYEFKKKYNYVPKANKAKHPGRPSLSKQEKIDKLKREINLLENSP